jgi:hypothetical protein
MVVTKLIAVAVVVSHIAVAALEVASVYMMHVVVAAAAAVVVLLLDWCRRC